MNPSIRDACRADHAFIVEANRRLALESEQIVLDPALLVPGVEAVLADRSLGRYFIAELAGRPIGQMMLTYEWSDWRNGVFWWIQSVYVDDAHRGAGVFSALFRHVAACAAEEPQVCGLRLYVDRANDSARAIYAHLGLHASNYEVMERVFRGPESHREN
jgi:GNAT superfamily N-acetyltransferase